MEDVYMSPTLACICTYDTMGSRVGRIRLIAKKEKLMKYIKNVTFTPFMFYNCFIFVYNF